MGEIIEFILFDLSPMLTKSELLRDASNKLCHQAHIERAKAEEFVRPHAAIRLGVERAGAGGSRPRLRVSR